ncbi:glycoside hydrolase family 97 protein [Pseudopedobacter beijingensis]|uniref:Glycoside hydrolase family 97 protein n=1 Tax=Pseudopedobacter beijingensis TaxID=1207056 RepID=A0ABW4IDL3_9SPHI
MFLLKKITLFLFYFAIVLHVNAQTLELSSPNKKLNISFNIADKIYYTVSADSKVLLKDNFMLLNLKDEVLGLKPKLLNKKYSTVNEKLKPIIALKYSEVNNHYSNLLLHFKGNYAVEFRAYDDGIAYRFILDRKGDIEIFNEEFLVNLSENSLLHLQQTHSFKTAYEEPYTHLKLNEWKEVNQMAVLPALIETTHSYKVLISESDVLDYPAMFLKKSVNGIQSVFPKQPLQFGDDGDRSVKILKEANYIAKTKGKRSFPWRYLVIAKEDKQLIENTMTFKLSSPNVIENPSWISPGQVSWEWWNDASPYGEDVNFVSGYNLDTYKYYIDFASKFRIPYIIMDEGWAQSTRDPYTPNPKVDLHELVRYGKTKNVDIILWLTWLTVDKNMALFKTFNEWGIKGVKIDFMDRSDQWMVNFYERVAKEAAKHKLFVDFHGSFKPAGLEYKYPNVLSYEGVRGMEQMGGCTPENSIYLPFIRNAIGPMDYTPGAMISMQPEVYRSERPNSASIGTRAYQMALFVIFESGLQMLADNPTLYYRNEDCTKFITSVPTTWDDTKVLKAKVGEIVVVAKRKGEKWFIGGMTGNEGRDVEIDLGFLKAGKEYQMTYFEDGVNAGRQAMDYRKKSKGVKVGERIQIKMARNGGWAAVIE